MKKVKKKRRFIPSYLEGGTSLAYQLGDPSISEDLYNEELKKKTEKALKGRDSKGILDDIGSAVQNTGAGIADSSLSALGMSNVADKLYSKNANTMKQKKLWQKSADITGGLTPALVSAVAGPAAGGAAKAIQGLGSEANPEQKPDETDEEYALRMAEMGIDVNDSSSATIQGVAAAGLGLAGAMTNSRIKKNSTEPDAQSDIPQGEYRQEGGSIVGAGTGKSDSIKAKVKKGSFIVPEENSAAAEAISRKYFGNTNNNTNLNQKGGSEVNLSNGEFMFTPEQKSKLKSAGVAVDSLAPNSKRGLAASFAEGGTEGDALKETLQLLEEEKKKVEAQNKKNKLDDYKESPRYKKQMQEIKDIEDQMKLLSEYTKKIKSLGPREKISDPAIRHQHSLLLQSIQKVSADVQDRQNKYNKSYGDSEKKLLNVLTGKDDGTKTDTQPVQTTSKKTGTGVGTGTGAGTGTNANTSISSQDANTLENTPYSTGSEAWDNMTGGEGQGLGYDNKTGLAEKVLDPRANIISQAGKPGEIEKMSKENQQAGKDYLDEKGLLNKVNYSAPDASAKNKIATTGDQEMKVSPEDIFAAGQMGIGLYNLVKDGKRPVGEIDPQFKGRVDIALAEANQAKNDAAYGLSSYQESSLLKNIEQNRRATSDAAADLSSNNYATAMSNMRAAGDVANRSLVDVAAADADMMLRKKQYAANRSDYANSLVNEKAKMQRQLLEDKLHAFEQNQISGANLLGAGIQNFFTNTRDKRFAKALSEAEDESKAKWASYVDVLASEGKQKIRP